MHPLFTDVYASPYTVIQRGACRVLCSFFPPNNRGEEGLEKTAKFIIYQDFDREYRWRLRSSEGATIAFSEWGHHEKSGCAQEIDQWKLEYPDVLVRDATVRGFEKLPLSQWLASQAT
jgi:uncharacterized protein YegP (UPF0339 family)